MRYTSTAIKNKYNKKAYKQFNVKIKPELYKKIDNFCKEKELSRSQLLQLAIDKLEEDETK